MFQKISKSQFDTILDAAAAPKKVKRKKKPIPVLLFETDLQDSAPGKSFIKKRNRSTGITKLQDSKDLQVHKPQGKTDQCYALDENRLKLIPADPSKNPYACIRGYIPGYTTDKVFHKVVVCGKENCKTCGLDYSVVHNRRVNRSFQKLVQLKKVGYLVVTVPDQLRNEFLDKDVLSRFRNFIRRKLKTGTNWYLDALDVKTGAKKRVKMQQQDSKRGLIRWHWCGDDCTTWKPHLNILLESGYWSPTRLEQFRQDVAAWFLREFKKPVPGNIYYAYTTDPNKVKHWLNYVLRPTAKNVTDKDVLQTIYKYKNTGYFGQFEKSTQTREHATAILSGADPETGEIIQWSSIIKVNEFNLVYKPHAKPVTIPQAKKPGSPDTDPDPPPLEFGLFVTFLADIDPAGTQTKILI